MVLDDMIKQRPFLAWVSGILLALVVMFTIIKLAEGNVSERFEDELKSKADTTYVKEAIFYHEQRENTKFDSIIDYQKEVIKILNERWKPD